MNKYKYTVAICNYNMEDTIYKSVESVANQLDDEYEILIIDDGSSDASKYQIINLQKKFKNIKAVYLRRKITRQLGETRNISIDLASGQYIILHIDADDIWEPYIKSFVKVFHLLEKNIGYDFLLQGQQINIAKKSFLQKHGPYRNLQRAQDRDLWQRLAYTNELIYLNHKVFRKRMIRPKNTFFFKAIHDLWFHILFDLRKNNLKGKVYLFYIYFNDFFKKNINMSMQIKIIRYLLLLPAFCISFFYENLHTKNMLNGKEVRLYRQKFGNLDQLAKKYNINFKKNLLPKNSYHIFYE